MKNNAIGKSKKVMLLAGLVLLAILLHSCGQKGDLILPEDAAKAEQEKKKNQRLF